MSTIEDIQKLEQYVQTVENLNTLNSTQNVNLIIMRVVLAIWRKINE